MAVWYRRTGTGTEVERTEATKEDSPLVVIGEGRLGGSIAGALRAAGDSPEVLGRELDPSVIDRRNVLMAVPDDRIPEVALSIAGSGATPAMLGHTSGATGLDSIVPGASPTSLFSLHPLQTVPDADTDLSGAPAAIAGSSPAALEFARSLATKLGMEPFEVDEEARVRYHAAASIASNFLVALEQEAADLLASAGVTDPRAKLAPLVRRTLENWVERGPSALTGPVARGDLDTVERHRAELEGDPSGVIELYDLMVERTIRLTGSGAER